MSDRDNDAISGGADLAAGIAAMGERGYSLVTFGGAWFFAKLSGGDPRRDVIRFGHWANPADALRELATMPLPHVQGQGKSDEDGE